MKSIFNAAASAALAAFFLVTAATLILRTAGYTYNFKKGALEQTGTLVVRSRPTGASVQINGKQLTKQTPLRLRQLPPALYDVIISRTGFQPWHGRTNIKSAEAVFMESIMLYPDAPPLVIASGSVRAAALSPDGHTIAWIRETTSSPALVLTDVKNGSENIIEPVIEDAATISWSPDLEHLLLTTRDTRGLFHGTVYLLPPAGPELSIEKIIGSPATLMRWSADSPSEIEAWAGRTHFSIEPVSRRITLQETVPEGEAPAPTHGPSKNDFMPSITTRGRFAVAYRGAEIRDSDLMARSYQWAPDGSPNRLLVWNDTEVWVVALGEREGVGSAKATLIERRSDGVTGAAWRADGAAIFIASGGTVRAIDLAEFGFGRFHADLATFDRITTIFSTPDGAALLVAGGKDNIPGIYRLQLE